MFSALSSTTTIMVFDCNGNYGAKIIINVARNQPVFSHPVWNYSQLIKTEYNNFCFRKLKFGIDEQLRQLKTFSQSLAEQQGEGRHKSASVTKFLLKLFSLSTEIIYSFSCVFCLESSNN